MLVERGVLDRPAPDEPGQFTWAQEGVIAEHLLDAGFADPEVAAVDFEQPYASVDGWIATMRDLSMRFGDAMATLDDAARADLRSELADAATPFAQPDGSLAHPGENLGGRSRGLISVSPARPSQDDGRRATLPSPKCSTTTTPTSPSSTARPSPSSATAPRATPTRST